MFKTRLHTLINVIGKKGIIISLLLFVLFGSVLRLYNLSSQSYWMDEGYTVNAVMSVSEHGNTVLDSGKNYSCPTYCYPTAYLVKVFGDTPATYRLLAVLAGLLLIPTIFLITRRLFNKHIALLASFFLTFSYWQVAWSRQARWYTLFTLLFWLGLFFFYQSLYSNKRKYLNIILTTIFTVLAVITHGLGYLLPVIFIGWIFIDLIFIQKRLSWKKSVLTIIGGAIILYLFNLISNIDILGYLLNTFKLHYVLPYYLSFYLRNYWLFITLGLIALFNRESPYKKEIYFLLFILGAYFISLSFFTDIVHYRYMFHLTPIFFILGSAGLLSLLKDIKYLSVKIITWIIALGLFATIAGGVFLPQTNYFLESDNPDTLDRPYYAFTPQPDWSVAYGYIKENKKSTELIISSHPHFNKIYLKESGYWIRYSYLGFDNKAEYSQNDKEYYVGAKIIDDLAELRETVKSNHGYIVYDYMVIEDRIPKEILDYIENNFSLVFHEKTNSYSEVWVYRF